MFQRALNLASYSDAEARLSLRAHIDFQRELLNNKIISHLFDSITVHLAKVFPMDLSQRRLDSARLQSIMKRLGRLNLRSRVVDIFLPGLNKNHRDL
jgi:hypothetical protein